MSRATGGDLRAYAARRPDAAAIAADVTRFLADTRALVAALTARMRSEESELYGPWGALG